MSVSKWGYCPEICDNEPCPGDCDFCSKATVEYAKSPHEIAKELRELADWADGNIWEVPITMPDVLREAAALIESEWG